MTTTDYYPAKLHPDALDSLLHVARKMQANSIAPHFSQWLIDALEAERLRRAQSTDRNAAPTEPTKLWILDALFWTDQQLADALIICPSMARTCQPEARELLLNAELHLCLNAAARLRGTERNDR